MLSGSAPSWETVNDITYFTQFHAVSVLVSAAVFRMALYYSTYGLRMNSRMYKQMEAVNLMLLNPLLWLGLAYLCSLPSPQSAA